jgi:hypothetical protein
MRTGPDGKCPACQRVIGLHSSGAGNALGFPPEQHSPPAPEVCSSQRPQICPFLQVMAFGLPKFTEARCSRARSGPCSLAATVVTAAAPLNSERHHSCHLSARSLLVFIRLSSCHIVTFAAIGRWPEAAAEGRGAHLIPRPVTCIGSCRPSARALNGHGIGLSHNPRNGFDPRWIGCRPDPSRWYGTGP